MRLSICERNYASPERPQTRLSSKCPELNDLLLKLKTEGR